MEKKVSVIVPVYNTEKKYLEECIESILEQEHRNIELLLINDGSSNEAPAVCEAAAARDERVIYLTQENAGVSVARNNGLDHASGEFVLFVDADDFLSPGIVTKLTAAMKEELDILFYGYCTSYTNREMVRVIKEPDKSLFTARTLQLAILNGNPRLGPLEVGAPWGKLIRRSVIENNNVRYTRGLKKGQDTVFTLHLLDHCKGISYLGEPGYHYRISSMSISHRYNENIIAIMEKTLAAYTDFVYKTGKDEEFIQALSHKHYRVLTGEYLDLYFLNKKNPAKRAQLKAEYLELMEKPLYKAAIDKIDESTLTGLDKAECVWLKSKNITMLWTSKRLLAFAKSMIVRDYE